MGSQLGTIALSEASEEMERPRITQSAREQAPITDDLLVVKYHADERTVDLHIAAVVVDKT
jgi:hypothetical protein